MTPEEFMELVSGLPDTEKLKVLRLLEIAKGHRKAGSIIEDCRKRGFDIQATIAELSKCLHTIGLSTRTGKKKPRRSGA